MQARINQRYCSKACKKTAENRAQSRRVSAWRAEARVARNCEWCGAEFTPKNSRGRFCSHRCCCAAAYNQRKGAAASARNRAAARATPDSIARVLAYLSLPHDQRWAKRSTLTDAELKLASKMWDERHGLRTVAVCTVAV